MLPRAEERDWRDTGSILCHAPASYQSEYPDIGNHQHIEDHRRQVEDHRPGWKPDIVLETLEPGEWLRIDSIMTCDSFARPEIYLGAEPKP